ncbi:protein of unknown function [Legionella micdadei]|uniref:F-box domain-containing protein n=1 Tax=Legionella micdadei TaxID=451 RepID=A0A098GC22_LEGMI|nr:hypothetical protein [Legionella micdadei]KTD27223.1 hypothetical protein Lmic_2158 [Legionella micdadei]CEG60039.1 protein of unknown function [Legionella micdadei]SCY62112.1 hypothetical protein SAMN02982997_02275 [Legionella micdadei]
MTNTDFFSPLPQEILVRIYSNLGLKELLSAWHTGIKESNNIKLLTKDIITKSIICSEISVPTTQPR